MKSAVKKIVCFAVTFVEMNQNVSDLLRIVGDSRLIEHTGVGNK